MSTEICAKCGTPVITGHTWSLDASRRVWRLCCLCTEELIHQFDSAKDAAPAAPEA